MGDKDRLPITGYEHAKEFMSPEEYERFRLEMTKKLVKEMCIPPEFFKDTPHSSGRQVQDKE